MKLITNDTGYVKVGLSEQEPRETLEDTRSNALLADTTAHPLSGTGGPRAPIAPAANHGKGSSIARSTARLPRLVFTRTAAGAGGRP